MTFLIDGYNLMHAVGSVPTGIHAKQFDAARSRFLDWLAESPALMMRPLYGRGVVWLA